MTRTERLEVICGLAWFLSDGFWLMTWQTPCYLAGVVAVTAAVGVFLNLPRDRGFGPQLVGIADTSWLAFNELWAYGDMHPAPWAIDGSKYLFGVGIALFICGFAMSHSTDLMQFVLRRLRLLSILSRAARK